MVGPAIWIRFNHSIDARGYDSARQAEGHGNIDRRAILRFTHWKEGNEGKVMAVGECNLRFLHADVNTADLRANFSSESFIKWQRSRTLGKEKKKVLLEHTEVPPYIKRGRDLRLQWDGLRQEGRQS